jgi:hypothetical protein
MLLEIDLAQFSAEGELAEGSPLGRHRKPSRRLSVSVHGGPVIHRNSPEECMLDTSELLPPGFRTVTVVRALEMSCNPCGSGAGENCQGDRVCSSRIQAAREAAEVGTISVTAYEPRSPTTAPLPTPSPLRAGSVRDRQCPCEAVRSGTLAGHAQGYAFRASAVHSFYKSASRLILGSARAARGGCWLLIAVRGRHRRTLGTSGLERLCPLLAVQRHDTTAGFH